MRFSLLVAAFLALGSTPEAQVRWEHLGFDQQTSHLVLVRGPASDGSQDTLYTKFVKTIERGIYRYDEPGWTLMRQNNVINLSGLEALTSGAIINAYGVGSYPLEVSRDGGRSWTNTETDEPFACDNMARAHESALAPPLGNPADTPPALYIGLSGLCRSDDGGTSFYAIDFDDSNGACDEGRSYDVADLPPSAAFPDGRLLVAAYNGMGYNTSDGRYTCSEFWEPFRWGVEAVEVHPDTAHPYGGTAYAILRITGQGFPGIYASEDGGETYQERRLFGRGSEIEYPQSLAVVLNGNGTLVAGIDGGDILSDGTIVDDRGAIAWSHDGGRTWEELTGEGTGWGDFGVRDVEVGRDGRIYAATHGGVWRTTEAVRLPVSSEPEPPEASGAELRITPNPASGAVRIALELDAPEAAMLRIFDARGREVHTEASGARGTHAWEVSTTRWSPGVYIARVESGGDTVTAQMTVAR